MARKRAVIVGINHYFDPTLQNLQNPVNDAVAIEAMLRKNAAQHEDDIESTNYEIGDFTLNSADASSPVTRKILRDAINWLFESEVDGALFFFAGHAVRSAVDGKDYLVTTDGTIDDIPGVDMDFLIERANKARDEKEIKSTTIVLDCCHAGAIGNTHFSDEVSLIGKGVTILSSCEADESARDSGGRENHGAFTSLLLDGLEGQAADLLGRVTPASLYALIDSRLSASEQRPIFKSNVNEFIEARKCKPRITYAKLKLLNEVFKRPDDAYGLTPAHEKEDDRGKKFDGLFGKVETDKNKHKVYRILQECFKNGLIDIIKPDDKPEHWDAMTDNSNYPPKLSGSFSMWHAAIFSADVKLNHAGRHYWTLASEDRLD